MKRGPRKVFKLLLFVLLFLVAGAIINVAVAWGLVCTLTPSSIDDERSQYMPYGLWVISSTSRMGQNVCQSMRLRRDTEETNGAADLQALVPYWAPFDGPLQEFLTANSRVLELRAGLAHGFPMLTLMSERSHVVDLGQRRVIPPVRGGIETSLSFQLKFGGGAWPRDLPLRPIWPGFAINTIFYAAIVWGLFATGAVPGYIKRRRRIKRGLCVKCAYPLGTSPLCSECGTDLNR